MWKSIIGAWMKVGPSLTKEEPSNIAEIFKQPIFGNPLILNEHGILLGLGGMTEGSAFAKAGYTRTKDLWNPGTQTWKSLPKLGMGYQTLNRQCKETIIASIPWWLAESTNPPREGDWVSNPPPPTGAPFDGVYFVVNAASGQARAIEFKRTTSNGRIQATTN